MGTIILERNSKLVEYKDDKEFSVSFEIGFSHELQDICGMNVFSIPLVEYTYRY